jgi:hypothetical protein
MLMSRSLTVSGRVKVSSGRVKVSSHMPILDAKCHSHHLEQLSDAPMLERLRGHHEHLRRVAGGPAMPCAAPRGARLAPCEPMRDARGVGVLSCG